MKRHRYLIGILMSGLILWACPEADFGKFNPQEEKKTHEELLVELQKLDVEDLRSKADMGDPTAQNDLGLLYIFGIGVKEDHKEAVSWFMSSAEQEDFWGMNNLAVAYLKGVGGLKRDQIEAHKWLNLAVAKAHREGQGNIGGIFRGTLKDIERHWYWLVKGRMSKAQQRAREWTIAKHGSVEALVPEPLLQRANRGEVYRQFELADRFHNGQGVPQDNIQAYKWYSTCFGKDNRCDRIEMLKTRMTKNDIAEGERLVQEWRSNH